MSLLTADLHHSKKKTPTVLSIWPQNLNFRNGGTWFGNFPKSIPEIREMFSFWQAYHSTEHSENSTRKIGSKENSRHEIFESLGILREVVLVFWSFEKCCFIHHWKFQAIQTRSFGRIEHVFDLLVDPRVVKWLVTWAVESHCLPSSCKISNKRGALRVATVRTVHSLGLLNSESVKRRRNYLVT